MKDLTNKFITAYNPLPITPTHGEGIWVWDQDGNKYLDALCGLGVTGLGHAHPQVTQTIIEQSGKLLHTSNIFNIHWQQKLAKKITEVSNMEQVFFCNSGAEANEAAIKLMRLYGKQKQIKEPKIIVTSGAFHGRSLATLSASGTRRVQAGFEPLVSNFIRAPYNDLEAIQQISEHESIVGILVEPIQGENGIIIPNTNYLSGLDQICKKNQWLLALDEVQTGNGRTGKYFNFQHFDIQPDLVTTAKGLGNGIPIGACLMQNSACDLFQPGTHGSTFGGNPLASATALTVINTIINEKLDLNAYKIGKFILNLCKQELKFPEIVDIRGQGLMIGIEMDKPCRPVLLSALKNKLLINVTAQRIIRLLPPLNINQEQAELLVQKLKLSLSQYLAN